MSHPLFMIPHHCSYHITSTECMISHTLYMTSHTWQHNIISAISPTISDTISTVSVSSHPLYVRYHIQCTCDILSTIFMTSDPVCMTSQHCVDATTIGICMTSFVLQMTSHPFYHTKPHYLWRHIHFRHDITPTLSDIAPTVSMSSQPLNRYHTHFCMTSHPLYVWYHMHCI